MRAVDQMFGRGGCAPCGLAGPDAGAPSKEPTAQPPGLTAGQGIAVAGAVTGLALLVVGVPLVFGAAIGAGITGFAAKKGEEPDYKRGAMIGAGVGAAGGLIALL
jgi:hypothetical protein